MEERVGLLGRLRAAREPGGLEGEGGSRRGRGVGLFFGSRAEGWGLQGEVQQEVGQQQQQQQQQTSQSLCGGAGDSRASWLPEPQLARVAHAAAFCAQALRAEPCSICTSTTTSSSSSSSSSSSGGYSRQPVAPSASDACYAAAASLLHLLATHIPSMAHVPSLLQVALAASAVPGGGAAASEVAAAACRQAALHMQVCVYSCGLLVRTRRAPSLPRARVHHQPTCASCHACSPATLTTPHGPRSPVVLHAGLQHFSTPLHLCGDIP